MLSKEKYAKMLEKLFCKTKAQELSWLTLPEYLEEKRNDELRRYIINNHKYFYDSRPKDDRKYLKESKCVCTEVLNGLVLIFLYEECKGHSHTDMYSLAIQSKIGGVVEELQFGDFQEELEKLYKISGAIGMDAEMFVDLSIDDL